MSCPVGLDGPLNSRHQTQSQRQMKQRRSGGYGQRTGEEGEMALLLLGCHVAVTCLFISVSFAALFHQKNKTKSCCHIYIKVPSIGIVAVQLQQGHGSLCSCSKPSDIRSLRVKSDVLQEAEKETLTPFKLNFHLSTGSPVCMTNKKMTFLIRLR